MFRTAFLLICLIPACGLAATLQEAMTTDEFNAAGLRKLSDDELTSLNGFLGRVPQTPAEEEATVVEDFGSEQLPDEPSDTDVAEIRSRIKGEFSGWEGHTYFYLANGQVWRQRISGRYRYRATDPAVTVEKTRFGYNLVVDDTGRQVGVKRVR